MIDIYVIIFDNISRSIRIFVTYDTAMEYRMSS